MGDSTRSGGPASRDPWYFERWAYEQTTGNAARKAVLVWLSTLADAGTGRCEAKVGTIAQATELGARTVSSHLSALTEAGFIARRSQWRYDGGRRGDEFLLLAPDVTEWPDGTPLQVPHGAPAPPRSKTAGPPRRETTGQERPLPNDHAAGSNGSARASSSDVVPDDFPAELRPHARRVMAVLRDVAERRGARRVTARAVALTVAARPRKPLVTAAHDCAAWIEDHPEVACRDVVARYRRWLDREPDLQGLERLDAAGVPTSALHERPANVRPIRPGGRGSHEDLADAERLRAMRLRAEAQA